MERPWQTNKSTGFPALPGNLQANDACAAVLRVVDLKGQPE
jgi:hypothetical protein